MNIFGIPIRTAGMFVRRKIFPGNKAKAEPILAAIGLSFSDVFNLTLNQICLKRRIPFELSAIQLTENGYTTDFEAELLAASNEAHDAVVNGAKTYKSAADLRAALDAEEEDE